MTLRRRKKPQNQKRKIQMRIHLHPRPRKRGVDPQLKKPPLKRNLHLKRNPNLKNASAHLSLQKVRCQKATLAKRKNKVVTLNHLRGSTKPRKLAVEGFVGQQQKNGKGVDQIPLGKTTVVLLQVRIQTFVESLVSGISVSFIYTALVSRIFLDIFSCYNLKMSQRPECTIVNSDLRDIFIPY